ncbi:adenosylcobinamide-GDP ribazoletransferase [Candidatus Clostridium radicumherbarum]|uniref:Adenosylcobinamide-GDP ribazoletransferase n=1 Tax=Candidatus Clostridium radicumherbarum TaxID=3381662 RepID=A0ABW8TQ77_9CLOT
MLQFLTRIPVNINLECKQDNFKKAAFYLPIIGLIVGGIEWTAYYILNIFLPANINAVLVFIMSVLITGALHIDGLGDTCDGFYAFKGKDRIIEIMKDSRIGSYACIAIVVDILLKVSSLTYIIENKLGFIIILAPIIGRLSIIFISLIGKTAKSTGSGNLFIGNMSRTIVIFAALLSFVISIILIGVTNSAIIFLISFIVTVLVNKYSESKINGITGDLLGANNELVEIFVLITCIAVNVLSKR